MNVFVDITLIFEEFDAPFPPLHGPVMAGEYYVRFLDKEVDRFIDEPCPGPGISHFGTSRRIEIMHGVGAVFGHAQGFELREVEVKLSRGLLVGRVLEDEFNAVNVQPRAGLGNNDGRRGAFLV